MENTNCISCSSCIACSSCTACFSCTSCSSCFSCTSCDSCKNLKMTEYNYFCWSTVYDSDTSFQQPRYRVFNVEVGREEYYKINKSYHPLKFDDQESCETRFSTAFKKMWDKLSDKDRQQYFDIPHFTWDIFTDITGIKKETKSETRRIRIGNEVFTIPKEKADEMIKILKAN